jgi:hypothetical protein
LLVIKFYIKWLFKIGEIRKKSTVDFLRMRNTVQLAQADIQIQIMVVVLSIIIWGDHIDLFVLKVKIYKLTKKWSYKCPAITFTIVPRISNKSWACSPIFVERMFFCVSILESMPNHTPLDVVLQFKKVIVRGPHALYHVKNFVIVSWAFIIHKNKIICSHALRVPKANKTTGSSVECILKSNG